MNSKIIDGKQYMVGERRSKTVSDLPRAAVEVFDGETFVRMGSAEAIDVHNKVLRDIYRRLDALEGRK